MAAVIKPSVPEETEACLRFSNPPSFCLAFQSAAERSRLFPEKKKEVVPELVRGKGATPAAGQTKRKEAAPGVDGVPICSSGVVEHGGAAVIAL